MKNNKIKKMTYTALGASFMVLCSWLTVPYAIPFTMQSFAVCLLLLALGGEIATVSIMVYLALGIIGLPVFSGFSAGLGVVLGPHGGFLIGFALMCILFWILESKIKKLHTKIIVLVIGHIICYAVGVIVYMLWADSVSNAVSFTAALGICVFPYLLPDTLKLILAVLIKRRLNTDFPAVK